MRTRIVAAGFCRANFDVISRRTRTYSDIIYYNNKREENTNTNNNNDMYDII